MLPIRTLLHPTDFSEPSHYAFELSCSLARDYDAELIICHVVESLIPYLGEGIVAPAIESYEEEMGENLLRLYPPPGIHAIHLLESGQPVAEILARGRGGSGRSDRHGDSWPARPETHGNGQRGRACHARCVLPCSDPQDSVFPSCGQPELPNWRG